MLDICILLYFMLRNLCVQVFDYSVLSSTLSLINSYWNDLICIIIDVLIIACIGHKNCVPQDMVAVIYHIRFLFLFWTVPCVVLLHNCYRLGKGWAPTHMFNPGQKSWACISVIAISCCISYLIYPRLWLYMQYWFCSVTYHC